MVCMERVLTDNSVLAKGQKECLQSVVVHFKISISRKYLESQEEGQNGSSSKEVPSRSRIEHTLAL